MYRRALDLARDFSEHVVLFTSTQDKSKDAVRTDDQLKDLLRKLGCDDPDLRGLQKRLDQREADYSNLFPGSHMKMGEPF